MNSSQQPCQPSNKTPLVPERYLCPISLQPMVHPMVSRTNVNFNFERVAILKWLEEGNRCCPLTRQTLRPSDLVSNVKLRKEIEQWRRDNNIPEPNLQGLEGSPFVGFVPMVENHKKNKKKSNSVNRIAARRMIERQPSQIAQSQMWRLAWS